MPTQQLRFPSAHSLPPLFPPVLPDMTAESLTAAGNAYRQPAPPPQLPLIQLPGRHQDPQSFHTDATSTTAANATTCTTVNPSSPGAGPSCPHRMQWAARGDHSPTTDAGVRTARLTEDELETLVDDMTVIVRREFDCWVQACWTEAFHHVFTRTLPTFLITLILAGASPTFMRRQIVHGGAALDQLFMADMLDNLYSELERRLSGRLMPDVRSEGPTMATAAAAIGAGGLGAQPTTAPGLPRDGVCTHDLGPAHGAPLEDEDHATCLCQLAACTACLHAACRVRKAPIALLPYELKGTHVALGWAGLFENEEQWRARLSALTSDEPAEPPEAEEIPSGRGFVRHAKKKPAVGTTRPPIFPHPQMTDVLAVEEHLRWRLKELGAADPSVESRYGPSVNAPAALDGLDRALRLDDGDDASEAGSIANGHGLKNGKMKVGRSKARFNKAVKAPPKPKAEKRKVYLPAEWAEADPGVRNTAIVLTFRHFVKLLYRSAASASPFSYPGYTKDILAIESVHPVAFYRRLTETTAKGKNRTTREGRIWAECMDKWGEELGAREKAAGNVLVNAGQHAEAVRCYTRAISLDAKKTVYYSNRAVALNALGKHALAEMDCDHILRKDGKNSKAFFQRAVARVGLQRWREADADLKQVLTYSPGNESAKTLLAKVKIEVAKLPKQRLEDVLNF